MVCCARLLCALNEKEQYFPSERVFPTGNFACNLLGKRMHSNYVPFICWRTRKQYTLVCGNANVFLVFSVLLKCRWSLSSQCSIMLYYPSYAGNTNGVAYPFTIAGATLVFDIKAKWEKSSIQMKEDFWWNCSKEPGEHCFAIVYRLVTLQYVLSFVRLPLYSIIDFT